MSMATKLLPVLLLLVLITLSCEADPSSEGRKMEEYGTDQESEGENVPYVFYKKSFKQWTKTNNGNFKVLERFSKRSELLIGIDNYRIAILEVEPRTFILPSHWDAEEVFYVINGKGSITMLHGENKESFGIRKGDVMRVPAGAIVYLVNNHSEEKLRIALLLQPIFVPGQFEEFYGVGGKEPESFYTSFSNEVLEAAFNTPRERLKRVFGKQKKGTIIKASEEQIRALSGHASTPWPFGQSKKPFNLLNKSPTHSNKHGQLYEARANDYEDLGDLDVDVAIANISKGSMMAPNYNTRATKIALVVEGQGFFEMACPHVSSHSERGEKRGEGGKEKESGGKSYHRIRARLSPGTVFVIPAGHPVIPVASGNENLQILCFGIRAKNNEHIFLSGKNNVYKEMETAAKELGFATDAREVDGIFNAQKESAFLPGPKQQQPQEDEDDERKGGGGRLPAALRTVLGVAAV